MKAVRQPFSLSNAVEQVLTRVVEKQVRQSSAAPVLCGISGIDCSGKSTLGAALLKAARAANMNVELVGVDDFIIPAERRKTEESLPVNYFEHTFDHEAFISAVRKLASNPGTELVIAEGVFLFRREMVGRWDLKVWMEMSVEQSITRGSVRDTGYFGSVEKTKYEYKTRFMPAHQHHLERDNPEQSADLVFEVN